MKFTVWALALFALICVSCVRGAFQPVNEGREYGDPVPLMVSHLGNSGPHYFLQDVICFDYLCRKKAGKRKAMKSLSFADFKKRIEKNAKKGKYKQYTPTVKQVRPDTLPVRKEPERIAPPQPAPVAAAPILQADSLITLNEFLFETNSYKLKGQHFASLDSLGKFLRAHPTLEVFVSGHTDNVGTERHNVSLSLRRAETVAEYLIDRGATFDRVTFEGFGSSKPIAGNDTETGRAKNRRVEILISNPQKK